MIEHPQQKKGDHPHALAGNRAVSDTKDITWETQGNCSEFTAFTRRPPVTGILPVPVASVKFSSETAPDESPESENFSRRQRQDLFQCYVRLLNLLDSNDEARGNAE